MPDVRRTSAGAGTLPGADGANLGPLLRGNAGARPGATPRSSSTTAPDYGRRAGPDAPQPGSGNPPTYEALRLPHAMYVEYANGEREYYDLDSDPYELTNIYPELSPDRVDALHTRLARMESCHGTASCRQAARNLP